MTSAIRTRTLRPSTRETVAHHEAGHVVALVVAAGAPARASIVPGDGTLGHVSPYVYQTA